MLQKILQNKRATFLILLSFVGIILVRFFENELFYDPFLDFFKTEYASKSSPNYNGTLLFVNLFFRYFLNAFFSILILHQLFADKNSIKFLVVLYSLFFIVLIFMFFVVLNWMSTYYFFLFYIRRFLIQPLFLVLFIPAFYYQSILVKK